jgi:ketosteroid isomerase-like protein
MQVDQKSTQLREGYVKAVSSGDLDRLLTFYTDDLVVMLPNRG